MKKVRNYTVTYTDKHKNVFYLKRDNISEIGCNLLNYTTNLKEAIKFVDEEGALTFMKKEVNGSGWNVVNLNPTSNRQKYVLLHKSGKSYYNIRHEVAFTVDKATYFDSIEEARNIKLAFPKGLFHIVPYNDLLKFEGNEYNNYILYNTYEKYYYKGIDSNKKQIYVNLPEYAFIFKGISEVLKHLASHWKSAHSWKILRPAHGEKDPILEKISYGIGIPSEPTPMTLDEKINSLREYVESIAKKHNNLIDSSEKEIKNIKIRLDNIEHKVDAFLKDLKTILERGL